MILPTLLHRPPFILLILGLQIFTNMLKLAVNKVQILACSWMRISCSSSSSQSFILMTHTHLFQPRHDPVIACLSFLQAVKLSLSKPLHITFQPHLGICYSTCYLFNFYTPPLYEIDFEFGPPTTSYLFWGATAYREWTLIPAAHAAMAQKNGLVCMVGVGLHINRGAALFSLEQGLTVKW